MTREDAIAILKRKSTIPDDDYCRDEIEGAFNMAIKALENQKTGHWIGIDVDTRGYCSCFECSNCKGFVYPHLLLKELDYAYCPNCGANMRGE